MATRLITRWLAAVLLGTIIVFAVSAAFYWHEGYRPYMVRTGSMAPAHLPGDLVLDAPAGGAYAVGDVITFQTQAGPVTHRVIGTSPEGLVTKGDANETADPAPVASLDVIGVVVRGVPRGGYILHFLSQPTGIASVMSSALALWLAWTIFFPSSPAGVVVQPPSLRQAPRRGPRPSTPTAPTALAVLILTVLGTGGVTAVMGVASTSAYFSHSVGGELSFSLAEEEPAACIAVDDHQVDSSESPTDAVLNSPAYDDVPDAVLNSPADDDVPDAVPNSPADDDVPDAVPNSPADDDVPDAVPNSPADDDVPDAVPNSPADDDVPDAVPNSPADDDVPDAVPNSPADDDVPACEPEEEALTDGRASDGTATDGTATDATVTDGTGTDARVTDKKTEDNKTTTDTTEETTEDDGTSADTPADEAP